MKRPLPLNSEAMSWGHINTSIFVCAGASWRWESGGERSERDDNGNQPAQPHTHTHYQGEFNTHIKLNAISPDGEDVSKGSHLEPVAIVTASH